MTKVHWKLSRRCRCTACAWSSGSKAFSSEVCLRAGGGAQMVEHRNRTLNSMPRKWKVRKSEVQAQIELYHKFEIGETLSKKTKITFKIGTLSGQYLGKY